MLNVVFEIEREWGKRPGRVKKVTGQKGWQKYGEGVIGLVKIW